MTIDKAIEINKIHLYQPTNHHDLDTQNALALGIEALKQVKELRDPSYGLPKTLLPGETEK